MTGKLKSWWGLKMRVLTNLQFITGERRSLPCTNNIKRGPCVTITGWGLQRPSPSSKWPLSVRARTGCTFSPGSRTTSVSTEQFRNQGSPIRVSARIAYNCWCPGYLLPIFVVAQSPSRVWLFATPETAAHQALLEFAQVHVHCISDAVQPSHPLTPSCPSALNLSQHHGLFQWVICSCQVTKIPELQLQHQSFWWLFRVDLP